MLILVTAAGFVDMFVKADSPDPDPEFYFTRLAYTENGSRGWGRFVP